MRRAREGLIDWWLPAVLALAAYAEVAGSAVPTTAERAQLAGLLPLALVVGMRRREPALAAVAVAALTVIYVLGVQEDPSVTPPLTAFLALLVASFSLGLRGRGRALRWGTATVLALVVVLQGGAALSGRPLGDVGPSTLFFAGAWVMGRLIATSRSEAAFERARARQLEVARENHRLEAVAAERTRIARELHDVVAHSLSLIVVQASVEARLATEHASSTTATLASIEQQGRAALVELRRLLGLLREDEASTHPLPTLDRVEELVDELRRAGHRVELARSGDVRPLAPGIELATYRILQEAVTNLARHAPGADVVVRLHYGEEAVGVTVDNGRPSSEPVDVPGPGLGIEGMRERVRVFGGTLEAGRTADGGFRVTAEIPDAVP